MDLKNEKSETEKQIDEYSAQTQDITKLRNETNALQRLKDNLVAQQNEKKENLHMIEAQFAAVMKFKLLIVLHKY